jgi:hypothetical protein
MAVMQMKRLMPGLMTIALAVPTVMLLDSALLWGAFQPDVRPGFRILWAAMALVAISALGYWIRLWRRGKFAWV